MTAKPWTLLSLLAVLGCSDAGSDDPQASSSGAPATQTGGASSGGASSGGQATGGSAGATTSTTGGDTSVAGTGSGGMAGAGAGASSGGTPGGGAPDGEGGTPPGGSGGDPATGGTSPTGGTDAGGSGGVSTEPMKPYTFPQNVHAARCTYPTMANHEDARRAYDRFKTEVVTSDGAGGFFRVVRPDSPSAEANSTVSEGIAYGMILAVMMDDQTLFDGLYQYSALFLNEHGLMNWYINAAGTMPLGTGGATDSDEDIAWALVMADRKWGGSGSLTTPYLDLAVAQIDAIWQYEVDHERDDLLLPGDSWGDNIVFNPSYFAPGHYRVFGEVSGNVEGWNRVIDTGYTILFRCLNAESGNELNGLAPAWCAEDGTPKVAYDGGPTNYQYDSARVPFRIGQDYCTSGEPRAADYLGRVSNFFAGIGASNIVDGYNLDGTPFPDPATAPGSPQSAVFVGGAAVGAMHDPSYQAFIDEAYALVATGELLARSTYYNLSWTTLSLLMMTGNLLEYPP